MRALWDCRDRQHGLLLAHRDILRHRKISVAFGAKRTPPEIYEYAP